MSRPKRQVAYMAVARTAGMAVAVGFRNLAVGAAG
jgi:hypothetical protein